jgi:hypothetical protein
MDLHPDFRDLLSALADSNAEYLVVGGWAVGYHSEARFTKDLDLFIGPSNENLEAVARALEKFGAPMALVDTLRGLGPTSARQRLPRLDSAPIGSHIGTHG